MESGKGISLFFKDGDYDGLMKVSGTNWRGLVFVVPRTNIGKMLNLDELKRFGVYLLLSDTQVYVGEASDLHKRIKQHDKGKGWWNKAVLITTTDDSLDQTDINYLEASIIEIAKNQKKYKCENKQTGNKKKLDDMKKAELDPFLIETLSILNVIGVMKINTTKDEKDDIIDCLEHGNGGRRVVIKYLKDKGFSFPEKFKYNYSARQNEKEKDTYKNECWINPNPKMLDEDWYIILNDTKRRELHILLIPHGTFDIENSFKQRNDKGKLDMFVNLSTFVERKSGINLAKYKYEKSYSY